MRIEVLLAITAMAVVTFGVRATGFLMAGHLPESGAAAAWLKRLPPAILASIVAPAVLTGSPAEQGAALMTVVTAALSRNLVLAMVVGVSSVWLLRQVI